MIKTASNSRAATKAARAAAGAATKAMAATVAVTRTRARVAATEAVVAVEAVAAVVDAAEAAVAADATLAANDANKDHPYLSATSHGPHQNKNWQNYSDNMAPLSNSESSSTARLDDHEVNQSRV